MSKTPLVRSATEWLSLRGQIESAIGEGATVAILARKFDTAIPMMAAVLDSLGLETQHKKLAREIREAAAKGGQR